LRAAVTIVSRMRAPAPWRRKSGCVRIDLISPNASPGQRRSAPIAAIRSPAQADHTVMPGAASAVRSSA